MTQQTPNSRMKTARNEQETMSQRAQFKTWAATLQGNGPQKEKDQAAKGIFNSLSPRLFYHYARTGGTGYNIDFARDLVMIALEKAFEKICQYDPKGGEFMTWVYTIANNTRTDYHRKNIKLVSIDEPIKINEEELLIEIEGQGPSPMDIALKNERGEQVKTAVAALSNPKERHLIYLRYFEQLSYDEIAEEMEMPLGTVKAMLFRAKENLQGLLSPEMLVRA